MFERYTEKARRVVFFARYEASQFGSPYIETEHLLLGLLREDKALTNRFLRGQDKAESIRRQIEESTVVREKVSTSVDLPLSNEGKRVLAYAAEEAEKLSHKHIGTEHLLLGLLREEKSFAAQLLHERGVRLSSIREELAADGRETEPAPAQIGKEFVLLSDYSRYLTRLARQDRLPLLIGREKELEQVMHILGRSSKNNVVLVGKPGVGKRTIAEGLVQRAPDNMATPPQPAQNRGGLPSQIAQERRDPGALGLGTRVPAFLENKLFVAIDLATIVSAAQHSPRSKEFLASLIPEFTSAESTIFLFDELYALLSADSGAHEISILLKPALLGGKMRCIALATPDEYKAARKRARWLERCFLPVEVNPASEAEALAVLQATKERFEKFHSVRYTEEALRAAVVYSNRYVKDRYLPDKAIDLIDDAGAYVKMKLEQAVLPEEVIEGRKRLRFIARSAENAINNHEFEKARFYSDEERKHREALRELEKKHNVQHVGTVTEENIAEALSRWTGMPVGLIRAGVGASDAGGERPVHVKKPKKKKSS
jgi:ATP-dependent Clp protease ATP-binding subunit ClpC